MANIITAGNSTNGGTQITTDTSGTLDIKTGSGSGVTAISIDASGNVSGVLKSGTAVASTSGTSIDFTSLPTGIKRITLNFAGVSTAGASSSVLIQLGTSAGIQNTGYLSTASAINNANTTVVSNFTAGVSPWSGSSAAIVHGSVVITLLDSSNGTWCFNGQVARSDSTNTYWCAGSKILSGTFDRIRITTVGSPPTDTFDAGSINILYE